MEVYKVSADGSTLTKIRTELIENGNALSFTTNSNGIYFIGTDMNTQITPGTTMDAYKAPSLSQTSYVQADSFENGQKYLIVGEIGNTVKIKK